MRLLALSAGSQRVRTTSTPEWGQGRLRRQAACAQRGSTRIA